MDKLGILCMKYSRLGPALLYELRESHMQDKIAASIVQTVLSGFWKIPVD